MFSHPLFCVLPNNVTDFDPGFRREILKCIVMYFYAASECLIESVTLFPFIFEGNYLESLCVVTKDISVQLVLFYH
jgi:hypothetical protein